MRIRRSNFRAFIALIALICGTGLCCRLTPVPLPYPTITTSPTTTSDFLKDMGTWTVVPTQNDCLIEILPKANPNSLRWNGQIVFTNRLAFGTQKPGLPGTPQLLMIGQSTSPAASLTNECLHLFGYAKFLGRWPISANRVTPMPPIDPAGSNSAVQDITGGLLLFPMSGGGMHAQIAGIQFWIIDPHRKCFTPVP